MLPDIKQHWPIETYLVQDVLSESLNFEANAPVY